jgi:hypothetical protein
MPSGIMLGVLGAFILYLGFANMVVQVSSAGALNILDWERTLSDCGIVEVSHFRTSMAVILVA